MGIWSNAEFVKHNPLPQSVKLTLGEGDTPLKIVELPGHALLAIKDENQNPNGSFKDRSLAYQISVYVDQGKKHFVISSSGNAAISAAAFAKLAGAELDVFVSEHINPAKLSRLEVLAQDYAGIRIHKTLKAKSDAIKFADSNHAVNLRGSQDALAVIGFKSIAYELASEYPEVDVVFLPCSSGTSAMGLMLGFQELNKKVAVIICQTTKIHPLAEDFDHNFESADASLADAISDRVALRKEGVLAMLADCGGSGVVISDAQLLAAQAELSKYGFDFSYNSLLGFAGYFKLTNSYQHPVVIATGL